MLVKLSPPIPAFIAVLVVALAAGCAPAEPIEIFEPNHRDVEPVPVPPPPPEDVVIPDTATPLPFDVIAQGSNSPVGAVEAVYRDREEWGILRESLPDVAAEPNFPVDGVLLAAIEASTGGYRVRFDNVYVHLGETVATYTVEVPGPGCMTTQALTEPFEAITVRGLDDGGVRFVQRRRAYDCE